MLWKFRTFEKGTAGFLTALAFIVSGCEPAGPVFAPVSGMVLLDGKPLDEGTIYFKTVHEGSMDRLEIKDGHFEGVVEVGERRVEICRYREGEPITMGMGSVPNRINTIPARYNTFSELTVNVTEQSVNDFTFEVTSK